MAELKPWDWSNSISFDKKYLLEEYPEKDYPAFWVNRALSYHVDCILYVNEINSLFQVDKKLQYDYLYHSIGKKKRFSKWAKQVSNEDVELISKHYHINKKNAVKALDLLTKEQIEMIRDKTNVGGV